MRNELKKIVTIGLSILMIFAFASCGSDENKDQQTQTTDNTKQEQTQNTEQDKKEESKSSNQYSQYIGSYEDEVSKRAYMNIRENTSGDGVLIQVHWSSSATDYLEWNMTGTLDGNKMVYSDCTAKAVEFDSKTDQKIADENFEFNEKGYFEIENGKLKWTGSGSDDCNKCVFVKK